MFKRIKSTYNTASVDELSQLNLAPMQEELDAPEKSLKQINKEKQLDKQFKGRFHCNLCPTKIIETEHALSVHLESKGHKKNLAQHYKEHP